MTDEPKDEENGLSEVEFALVDAYKSLADVLMAMNPNAATALTTSYEHQRNGNIQKDQPHAAALFELLRRFVADPERQAYRLQLRKLLSEPSQGSA